MKNLGDIKKFGLELKRLQKLVFYDELTGILNRRGFNEEAAKAFRAVSFRRAELERRIGFGVPFAVLFIDLDDFKKLNDVSGHKAGDLALKKVAGVLRDDLRSSDIYARWGGEEFVVALVGVGFDAARAVAEKLRRDIARVGLSASIGVGVYVRQRSLAELVADADKAMYQAKKTGKNRVVVLNDKRR